MLGFSKHDRMNNNSIEPGYIGQHTRKGAGDSHARWLSEMPVRGQPTRM
jgi:hypothetical protein